MSATLVAGLLAPVAIYATVLILHLILPARRVEGYVMNPETGRAYRYRLNGLAVLTVAIAGWALITLQGATPADWLYSQRWTALLGACVLGLGYTLVAVLREPPVEPSLLTDLFLGRKQNVQYLGGRVDAKMFLYLAGAVMLALNTLAFSAHHVLTYGADANPGVLLHAALLLFFVVDYLLFERVHLYTYDLFAERVGFKLGWGCLVFYPYFYPIGLWATADLPASPLMEAWGVPWLVTSACVFLGGWLLARGANLQKYRFKRFPERPFLGIAPRTMSTGNLRLLCSGFWGVSRHVNYLGELLMALGLALSLGHPDNVWPWLYPLYYVALLVPRERDDDRRCQEKYGPLWEAYRQRVPARIIPGIY